MNDTTEQHDPQAEVFAFLADPATHGGEDVRRIDTHAASVFLAGDRALKVKRAVQYCFLDFSTLEKRKAACEAELEVNRRLAPTIYRRAVAITREADGTMALGGSGTPVEWAVEMRRFDDEQTFDHLARAGSLDEATVDALARVVAASHAGAAPPATEPAEWIAGLARYIDEQEAGFAAWSDVFPAHEVAELARLGCAFHARVRPLLMRRGRDGFIRRIHGDLHLGNIVLLAGKPVLFDAIEFSPLIATGDVLYDLAYLLMDLMHCGLGAAANAALNRYLVEARRDENFDALQALPLFLSVRAQIRGNVTAARLAQTQPADHPEIKQQALSYFRLAQMLIKPQPPTLVAVGGLSGTGKSALARALAFGIGAAPGAVVLRSDVERKTLAGVRETERLPASAYSAERTAAVYQHQAEKARRILAAGHSAVVDAVFAKPEERSAIEGVAQAAGATFHGAFLTADLATRLTRLQHRRGDASDADAAVARQQEGYDLGRVDWIQIDASQPLSEVAGKLRARLHESPARAT